LNPRTDAAGEFVRAVPSRGPREEPHNREQAAEDAKDDLELRLGNADKIAGGTGREFEELEKRRRAP
jgi:hypothetical protein